VVKTNWGSEVGQTRDQVSRDHVVKTNWGSEVGQTRDQVSRDHVVKKNWGSEVGQTRDQVSRDHVLKQTGYLKWAKLGIKCSLTPLSPKKKKTHYDHLIVYTLGWF